MPDMVTAQLALEVLTQRDLTKVVLLPRPRLAKADLALLRELGAVAHQFWLDSLNGNVAIPDTGLDYNCGRCPDVHHCDPELGLNRALMVAGGIYIMAAKEYFYRGFPNEIGTLKYPGCDIDELNALRESRGQTAVEWTRPLLDGFTGVLHAVAALRFTRSSNASLEVRALDEQAGRVLSRSLSEIYHVFSAAMSEENIFRSGAEGVFLSRAALSAAIHLQLQLYSRPLELWSKSHVEGPFSAINLSQLQLLAERSPAIADRVGGSIEKVFEQQLALLVQSLGFYVVSTRTGERSVDLLCISADPTSPYSFLLEAKTSGRAYSLPTKDERALVEYIGQVRQRLTTLPGLGFVLLVGPSATSTLAKKLRKVELDNSLPPIRFCRASTLAHLRENLLGPPPLSLLRAAIIRADYVVQDDAFAALLGVVKKRESAQADVVRAFLDDC